MVSIRDELSAFNDAFAVALERRDAERLADLFAIDAVVIRRGAATQTGREQIRQHFVQLPHDTDRITFESGEIIEDGDLVVDIGSRLTNGERTGGYVIIYRRQPDGGLRIAADVPLGSVSRVPHV